MNEALGKTAADSGSGVHDLTLRGHAHFLGPAAGGGTALDGKDDYLDFVTGFAFAAAEGFTFAAWVRHDAFQNNGRILYLFDGGSNTIELRNDGTTRRAFVSINNGGRWKDFTTAKDSTDPADIFFPPTGQWAHVVWTVTSTGTLVLYRDGATRAVWQTDDGRAANPNPGVVYTYAALARSDVNSGDYYFHGALRDARLYNRALSAEQIKDLVASTAPWGHSESGPLHWWKMDEAPGTEKAADSGFRHRKPPRPLKLKGSAVFLGPDAGGGASLPNDGGQKSFLDFGGSGLSFAATDGAFTFAVWVNFASHREQPVYILYLADATSYPSNSIQLTRQGSAAAYVYIKKSGAAAHFYGPDDFYPVAESGWAHVALTVGADGAWTLYRDGAAQEALRNNDTANPNTVNYKFAALGATKQSSGVGGLDGALRDARLYDRALDAEQIADLVASTALVPPWGHSESGPIHWWLMNEASGKTAADSGSDGGAPLTLKNGAALGRPSGGGGVALDGIDDYVDFPDAFAFAAAEGFAFAAWVRPDAFQRDGFILNLFDGGRNYIQLLNYGTSRRARVRIRNNGPSKSLTTPDGTFGDSDANLLFFPPAGQWVHVAFTVSKAGAMALYRDGATRVSDPATLEEPNGWTRDNGVAANPNTGVVYRYAALGKGGEGELFRGALRDVRLYNYALDQQQINELVASTAPWGHSESGPIHWWEMNEASGNTAADSGSGGEAGVHDLALRGGARFIGPAAGGGVWCPTGADDYLDFVTGFAFAAAEGFTFAAWVRHDAFQDYGRILYLQDGGSNYIQLDEMTTRQARVYIMNGGTSKLFTTPDGSTGAANLFFPPKGQWAHVAVTITAAGVLTIYRDGTTRPLWQTSDGVAANPNFGVVYTPPGRLGSTFRGALRDARLYNRALSAKQIADLVAATAPDKLVHMVR